MAKNTSVIAPRIHACAYFRLKKLCVEIQRGQYPNKMKLAQVLECKERTVQRELRRLENDYDAPLEFSREHNGFFLYFCGKYIKKNEKKSYSFRLGSKDRKSVV